MIKKIGVFCILFPFVFSAMNLQGFVSWYVSNSLGQVFAYANLGIIILGISILTKEKLNYSSTAKLWFLFYLFYYFFGLISSVRFNRFDYFFQSIIPVIYFIGFLVFLRNTNYRLLFLKVMTIVFILSSFFLILFYKIGYDVDTLGSPEYGIDRAEGLFGDANNSCLIALLTFVISYMNFKSYNLTTRIIRVILLIFIFYSIFITFSTTGLFIFSIIFILVNYEFFSKERLLLLGVFAPIFYGIMINLNTITAGIDLTRLQRVKIDNIVNLLSLNTAEIDSSGRDELLTRLFEYVLENPLIGNSIGFGNSMSGHNTFIGIWADSGFLTFIVFLLLLFTYFARTFKTHKKIKFFNLSFLIILSIYMVSLQTVINQPYLMAVFVYLAYLIDTNEIPEEINFNNLFSFK